MKRLVRVFARVAIGVVLAVAVALLAGLAWWYIPGPYERGLSAYQQGDYVTALERWRPMADRGGKWAQARLGLMYSAGIGVPQDDAQAVVWFKAAAEQGHAESQFNLGLHYHNGTGVQQDATQARSWFRKAAVQGLAEAQHNLGVLLAEIQGGVEEDFVRAYMWLTLAADGGSERSGRQLKTVAKQLNAEQIARAERMAREWQPQ